MDSETAASSELTIQITLRDAQGVRRCMSVSVEQATELYQALGEALVQAKSGAARGERA